MSGRRRPPFVALLLAIPLIAGCSLVGYPAGSVSDIDLAPRGSAPAGSIRADDPPSAPPLDDDSADEDGGAERAPSLRNPPAREGDAGRTYEVFEVEYRVLDTAVGYDRTGTASWYGEAFNGRPTASGEIFDMHGLSAAHRTLPLHTWVEVENLDNGARIVVKVNDRGPFADTADRIIDVSYGAARVLGMVGPGLARVRVRSIEPPVGG